MHIPLKYGFDGKILYENGQYPTIDLERVFYEVERSRQRILTELALSLIHI